MTTWTTNYHNLKQGDIFELEDNKTIYTVLWIEFTPSNGQGMGEKPPTWKIHTNKGYFTYDPWAAHVYKKYKILCKGPSVEPKRLTDVFKNLT